MLIFLLGNFVGPLLFKPVDAPLYVPGFTAVVITAIVAAGFVAMYRVVCALDNRKRDKSGIMEGYEHAYEDDLTDRKVIFCQYCGIYSLLTFEM